jgi:hypothetical protein
MEFRLKEGWFDYFASGMSLGALLTILLFVQQYESKLDFMGIVGLFLIVLGVIVFFVCGCIVKKKPRID